MAQQDNQRFLFNASGAAFAGRVLVPYADTIAGEAATSLSIDGGASNATSSEFKYRDIFSFASAVTSATGSYVQKSNAWETLVTTRVEGLNILNVVTADLVVARLSSRQERGAPNKDGVLIGPEPEHLPLGSYFENLRIAGSPITTASGKMSTKEFARFSQAAGAGASEIVLSSIFDKVSSEDKSLVIKGNDIEVPGFGHVVLGELFVARHERRLTMIRVELEMQVVGHLSVAAAHGNGTPFPPYHSN